MQIRGSAGVAGTRHAKPPRDLLCPVALEGAWLESQSGTSRIQIETYVALYFIGRNDEKTFARQSPVGTCSTCWGFGYTLGIDLDRVIPDPSLSLKAVQQPYPSPRSSGSGYRRDQ
ncbi:MAG TPA: hypothetical protein VKP30_30860 [Polyangiaceae bacterium]|nr:hypothetical protein [Polyangiaceae bacterium]